VLGLVAAGRDPARVRRGGSRSPLAYLRSLVGANGAIRYSRTSAQTPVWVTAQAVTALAGKAFPLAPTPRKRRAAAAATPTPTATPRPERTPDPKPAPTAAPARLAAAPATPRPAITPLTALATALPALTAERAARAGGIAAIVVRTWLPPA
jgi:hypothetical protein